jgi:hypothetical protein
MTIDLVDAIELVLKLARKSPLTSEETEACNILEDFAVNELGDN